MACIRKRRGKYVVDYRDNLGVRRWITHDTRKDAEKELGKILNREKKAVDEKATVKERAEQWLETEAKARLKPSTYAEYRRAFECHIFPRFGQARFCKVERRDVIRFIAELKEQGLARATVKSIIAPLRAMYFDAIVEGEALANPAVKLGKYLPEQVDTKHARA